MTYEVTINEKHYHLELVVKDGLWRCVLDGHEVAIDPVLLRPNVLSLIVNGASFEIKRELTGSDVYLWADGGRYRAEFHDPRSLRSRRAATAAPEGAKKVLAPMPGKVVRILVSEATEVQSGQGVVVVEAMKMQNELKSPKQGIVRKVLVDEGASVNAGDVLLIIE